VSYTEDEIASAVGELVQGTLTFPTIAGQKDRGAAYREVLELVVSVLLQDPDSGLHFILLGLRRLAALVTQELTACSSLQEALDDLAMPNLPVESVQALRSAAAGAQALQTAAARRGGVAGPELVRCTVALGRVRETLARSVRQCYVPRGAAQSVTDLVRPADEARPQVLRYLADVEELHEKVLARADQLLAARAELTDGGVQQLAASRQLSRVATQLDTLHSTLDALNSHERVSMARSSLLQVLASTSLLELLQRTGGTTRLEQIVSPSPTYRVRAYGSGSAPSVSGTLSSPYTLYPAGPHVVGFSSLNGVVHTVDVFSGGVSEVAASSVATLLGGGEGDFAIAGDLATPYVLLSAVENYDTNVNGYMFYLAVDGVLYEKALPFGVLTAAQVQIALSAAPGWTCHSGGVVPPPVTFAVVGGKVQITYVGSGVPTSYRGRSMEVGRGFQYASDLWNWTVDPGAGPVAADRSAGWDANDKLWVQPNDYPGKIEVALPVGVWPDYYVTAGNVAAAIDAAAVAAGEAFTATADGTRVRVSSTLYGEGSIVTLRSGGLYGAGAPMADPKPGTGTPSELALRTLGFVGDEESRGADVPLSSVVTRLNDDSAFTAAATATAEKVVYLTSRLAVRSAASALRVPVEADPLATWPAYGELRVTVVNGDNSGVYALSGAPSWAAGLLTLPLTRRLRDTTAGRLHAVQVYRERLVLTSKDATLTGELELDDPVGSCRAVLGLDAAKHAGTVGSLLFEQNDVVHGWLAMDLRRLGFKVADQLLSNGAVQTTISALTDLAQGVVAVSPGVVPSFGLSSAGFVVQSGTYAVYLAGVAVLQSWMSSLGGWVDLRLVYRASERLLAGSPTRAQVDRVYTLVEELVTLLTVLQIGLAAVQLSSNSGADRALRTLESHGYTRARDLLLAGRFAELFASDAEGATYSRALQKTANEVAVELVNNTTGARARVGSSFARVRTSWSDVDPAYTFNDVEDELPESPVLDYPTTEDGGA